jgi:hypothetical protein
MPGRTVFENLIAQCRDAEYRYLTNILVEKVGEELVTFVQVGHNASHNFFVGLKADGTLMKRSSGYWNDHDHGNIEPYDLNGEYLGHW